MKCVFGCSSYAPQLGAALPLIFSIYSVIVALVRLVYAAGCYECDELSMGMAFSLVLDEKLPRKTGAVCAILREFFPWRWLLRGEGNTAMIYRECWHCVDIFTTKNAGENLAVLESQAKTSGTALSGSSKRTLLIIVAKSVNLRRRSVFFVSLPFDE